VRRRIAARLTAIAAVAALAATPVPIASAVDRGRADTAEMRGLWVGRGVLTSSESIAAMVREAGTVGVNTLFVQVRGRGEAYYRSAIEPRASDLASQPSGFDPLAETLARAHAAGLRVHAWVNVNLVASAVTAPQSGTHVARRHPEWLMVPRALAGSLAKRSPRSAGYVDALSTWTAAASQRVEGLFLSPLVPAAQDYTVAVVREIVQTYPLDGLHLDYIRYPGSDFDYGKTALAEFRRTVAARGVAPAERRRLDRAASADPTIWARNYPAAWTTFREERLTSLLARLRTVARQLEPGLPISAAVAPDLAVARADKLQPWGQWADAGYLDAVCPMIYTADPVEFEQLLTAARTRLAGRTGLWAGIGAYRLTAARTAANVRAARERGAEGVLLFSYEQLTADPALQMPAVRDTLRAVLVEGPAVQSP
jgi:uncharacterized lipoprotein YddW (UPF0748 family)